MALSAPDIADAAVAATAGVTNNPLNKIPWYAYLVGIISGAGTLALVIRKVYWGDKEDARSDRVEEAVTAGAEKLVQLLTAEVARSSERIAQLEAKFDALARERDQLLSDKLALTRANLELQEICRQHEIKISNLKDEVERQRIRLDQQDEELRRLKAQESA